MRDLSARIVRELMLESSGLTTVELALEFRTDVVEVIRSAAALEAVGVLQFHESEDAPDWTLGPLVEAALARRIAQGRGVEFGEWVKA